MPLHLPSAGDCGPGLGQWYDSSGPVELLQRGLHGSESEMMRQQGCLATAKSTVPSWPPT